MEYHKINWQSQRTRQYFTVVTVTPLKTFCKPVLTTTKKNAQHKMWVKFYLEQNEDNSLGDSFSDSSEELPQRGSEEGQHICDFAKGGCVKPSIHFGRSLLLITGRRCLC